MKMTSILLTGIALASATTIAQSALGGAHTWRVHEAFSTADGLIQYIEVKESFNGNGETFIQGAPVSSGSHTFNFPGNLSGSTAGRSILLGTADYAALPGAPAPDHIIPANFFNPNGDTLQYSIYTPTLTWTAGQMPTDCVHALRLSEGVVVNSPTNWATNTTATIDACPKKKCEGDANSSGAVNIDDLVIVITTWGQTGGLGDVNGSGQVNIDDLVMVITNWGGC